MLFRSEVEADYTHVHFSFPFPYPLAQGSIYIIGELTGNELQPFARMTYNYNTSQYEAVLLLKQGYYNYMYIMVPEGKSKGETASTEGNHWEAPNEYILLVYHREPGDAFDKIIGYFLSQQ